MEKFISIINTPAASSGDCVVTGSNVAITGLKAFNTADIVSFKVNKALFPTGMRYSATTGTVAAGDVFRFTITQDVNNIAETSTFSYVVDTYNNLGAAIAAWVAAQGLQVTITVSGSLGAVTLVVTGTTSNVNFEIGGSITSTAGVITPIAFVYTAQTTLTTMATLAGTPGTRITFSKASHGLRNGQIVTINGFNNNAAAFNGGVYRVTYVSSSTFTLSYLTGALVLCATTPTAAATEGTVVLLAATEFGTAAQVNEEAAANGFTQTATNLTSYYSCVEIQGSYLSTATGNLVQRQLFTANVWYTEALAAGTTAPSADVLALEATLSGLVKA
jgi:hypothetical protein